MQHVGRNSHHCAAADPLTGEFIRFKRHATYGRERRIESVRLLDHGARFNEAFGYAVPDVAKLPVSFCLNPLPPLGRLRQQK